MHCLNLMFHGVDTRAFPGTYASFCTTADNQILAEANARRGLVCDPSGAICRRASPWRPLQ